MALGQWHSLILKCGSVKSEMCVGLSNFSALCEAKCFRVFYAVSINSQVFYFSCGHRVIPDSLWALDTIPHILSGVSFPSLICMISCWRLGKKCPLQRNLWRSLSGLCNNSVFLRLFGIQEELFQRRILHEICPLANAELSPHCIGYSPYSMLSIRVCVTFCFCLLVLCFSSFVGIQLSWMHWRFPFWGL
jgi:hypothetical protein